MANHSESSAAKIRVIAMEFLENNVKKQFKRKQLELYIDSKLEATEGAKTGALNRLLIDNEQNGIFQVNRGLYLYDPEAQPEHYEVLENLQKIMDNAFEQVKVAVNRIGVVDYLTEEDLGNLAKIQELIKMQKKIDAILGVKETDM
ncbi:hypothetical protein COL94_28970 [Bacillus wiedmannii]|uniref:hypothetical protein n=1 Tax=Bacillus wiedmannii TaxID=1890302 RepID=UPI000BF4C711|nr:hypothetical protein [Bacillus wiedmannii]PGA79649.1 hypothetical protein COL94_28970 [Bacillus wiedmannii]